MAGGTKQSAAETDRLAMSLAPELWDNFILRLMGQGKARAATVLVGRGKTTHLDQNTSRFTRPGLIVQQASWVRTARKGGWKAGWQPLPQAMVPGQVSKCRGGGGGKQVLQLRSTRAGGSFSGNRQKKRWQFSRQWHTKAGRKTPQK